MIESSLQCWAAPPYPDREEARSVIDRNEAWLPSVGAKARGWSRIPPATGSRPKPDCSTTGRLRWTLARCARCFVLNGVVGSAVRIGPPWERSGVPSWVACGGILPGRGYSWLEVDCGRRKLGAQGSGPPLQVDTDAARLTSRPVAWSGWKRNGGF